MDDGNKVSRCACGAVRRSKSNTILFNAQMSKANGASGTCKLLSNWPVRILKPCQTAVRKGESKSERTYRITGLVAVAIHCTFH